MNIERDKFYRTRGGAKLRAVCIDAPGALPVVAVSNSGCVIKLTKEGYCSPTLLTCIDDIAAPWIDKPEVDWSVLPPWFFYAAKGLDGQWRAYIYEPKISQLGWWYGGEFPIVIPTDYAPKWTGDWKDSLVTREVAK